MVYEFDGWASISEGGLHTTYESGCLQCERSVGALAGDGPSTAVQRRASAGASLVELAHRRAYSAPDAKQHAATSSRKATLQGPHWLVICSLNV